MIYVLNDNSEIKVFLDLAVNPRHDVKTTMEPGRLAVDVPDYLFERFQQYQSLKSSSPIEPKKSGSKT